VSDATASTILIGAGTFVAGVILAAIVFAAIYEAWQRRAPKATKPEPEPRMPIPERCELCRRHRARTVARTHTDEIRRVCFGCLDEGFVREWWAAS
jgi:hypothetical protein